MISRNMLFMSVKLYQETGRDADRKPVYGAPVILDGVYFDNTTGQTEGDKGKTPASSGILYYDCIVSRPKNITFNKKSVIEYQGEKYSVSTIKECRNAAGVSHYEIGVK